MAAVFLTGGTGFLGSRVCRALRQHQHSVRFLTRSGRAPDGVTPVVADLLDTPSYREALRSADVVVHLAAATGNAPAREHARVNAEGTEALIAECRGENAPRLLFTSTIAAKFADVSSYDYARTKRRAEAAIAASGLRFAILRPTIILGPGSATLAGLDRLARLPVLPIVGDGRALVQPIFVDDVVRGVVAVIAGDRFRGETIELGGPATLPIEELLQRIREARTGTRARAFHVPLGAVLAALRAARTLGLSRLLPLNAGQLSAFRYDSTADGHPFADGLRPAMAGLEQMLA